MCKDCDASLAGVRLGFDGEAFRIPEGVYVKTGDSLVFLFRGSKKKNKEKWAAIERGEQENYQKTEFGWDFFVPLSGLTATDESIYIGDEKSNIYDAVFYANKNDSFTKQERLELGSIVFKEQWEPHVFEYSGVSTTAFSSQSFLHRYKDVDTNTKKDFFRGFLSDDIGYNYLPSEKNNSSLFFEKIIITPQFSRIFIQNTGTEPVNMKDFFLVNAEKFLTELSETDEFLFPGQSVVLSFPVKKLPNNGMLLQIFNRSQDPLDAFCFLPTEKTARARSRLYFKKILHSPVKKECFRHVDPFQGSVFDRKNYLLPLKKEYYSSSALKIGDVGMENNYLENKKLEDEKPEDGVEKVGTKKNPEKFLNSSIKQAVFEQDIKQYSPENFPIKISKVLPNPKGRDTGNEKIFLKNEGSTSFWLRDVAIKTQKSKRSLPNMFFLPFEEKEVHLFSSLPLRNSDGDISLVIMPDKKNRDLDDKDFYMTLDSVSWKKARDDEFFGHFAPRYVVSVKKPKNSQKIKKLKNSEVLKNIQDRVGIDASSDDPEEEKSFTPLPQSFFKNKNSFSGIVTFSVSCFLLFFLAFFLTQVLYFTPLFRGR